jgi:hypothetical protein
MIAIPRGITVCSSVRAVGAKARVRVCMRVHVRVRGQLRLWARAMRCSAFLCKLPHPARGAAAALSLAVGPRLEAQQRFPSLTQPLGATHSEFFAGAQTQGAGRGCAEPRMPLIRQRAGNDAAMASALRAAPAACSAPGSGAR